ncbi:MAG: hypothetical protein K0R54_687 [Clostridiaceae bacterium]|jgi:hypothetical protein|nr:hypothetical protein [Clostridiaceae bacterium]
MNFISEDKKQITLPVELGQTVYRFNTNCCDACLFQKELFDKLFPKTIDGRCGMDKSCHTRFRGTEHIILTLDNLGWILNNWNLKVFKTEKEAEEKGKAFVLEHIKKFKELGFSLDKNGYSINRDIN